MTQTTRPNLPIPGAAAFGMDRADQRHTPVRACNGKGVGKTRPSSRGGGALVVKTGHAGVFTSSIPKAGFRKCASLGVGPATAYDGKELRQDAVVRIPAHGLE